jgi:capsular polysaccharide export protein
MALHAFLYYGVRTMMGFWRQERVLYHLQFQPAVEILNWVSNFSRFLRHRRGDHETIRQLSESAGGRYFIVPLQVATDANQRFSSLGWDNLRLAVSVLKSFAEAAPEDARLVFKVHPMERGHSSDRSWIRSTAVALGLGDRVHVIDTGSLGELARHAAGMITINSTSGLTAIFHGIPLLVVGESLYAHPALATCAHGNPDFDSFWRTTYVAGAETRRRYLAWLRESALIPGDFYNHKGIKLAVVGVIKKITQPSVSSSSASHSSVQQKVVSISQAGKAKAAPV